MGFSVALLLKAYGQFNAVVACGLQAWTNWELSLMLPLYVAGIHSYMHAS